MTLEQLKTHIKALKADNHIFLNQLIAESELKLAKEAFDLVSAAEEFDTPAEDAAAPTTGRTLAQIRKDAHQFPKLAAIIA